MPEAADKVTLGLIQMKPLDTKEASLDHAIDQVRETARRGAQVICLPELFALPYFPQKQKDYEIFRQAETANGNIVKRLSGIAKETRSVLIGGSFFETDGHRYYNTCPVIESDGRVKAFYRKVHLPNDELYYETRYFEPGSSYKLVDTSKGKIAPLICFDQWMTETHVALADKGAQMIIYPTAIGFGDGIEMVGPTEDWPRMWRTAMAGDAVRNGVYIAAVNRFGREDKLNFWGQSMIIDPTGEVIAKAGDKEEIIIQELDLNYRHNVREAWGFSKAAKHNIRIESIK